MDYLIRYNESNLRTKDPEREIQKKSGRKTSFEDQLTIIEELIKHDLNYNQ